jgi:hypothetical protein
MPKKRKYQDSSDGRNTFRIYDDGEVKQIFKKKDREGSYW